MLNLPLFFIISFETRSMASLIRLFVLLRLIVSLVSSHIIFNAQDLRLVHYHYIIFVFSMIRPIRYVHIMLINNSFVFYKLICPMCFNFDSLQKYFKF